MKSSNVLLWLDDEREILSVMKTILEKEENFEYKIFRTAEDLIKWYNETIGGKDMKKVLLVIIMFVLCLTLTGCREKNIEGSLEEIMTKVYSTLKQDETPMMLTNIQITEENVEAYLGTTDIKFKEALASESATGSIGHSVVLIRVDEKTNVEQVKET